MNKKSITPNLTQPIDRIPTGQLPSELAELSENTLRNSNLVPSFGLPEWMAETNPGMCSYDADAE